jgi:hypothetical protein
LQTDIKRNPPEHQYFGKCIIEPRSPHSSTGTARGLLRRRIKWGRKGIVDDTEVKNIFFTQVEIDEAQIESQGRITLSELGKKSKK